MDWRHVQGVFQYSWDKLQIRHNSERDKAMTNDEISSPWIVIIIVIKKEIHFVSLLGMQTFALFAVSMSEYRCSMRNE